MSFIDTHSFHTFTLFLKCAHDSQRDFSVKSAIPLCSAQCSAIEVCVEMMSAVPFSRHLLQNLLSHFAIITVRVRSKRIGITLMLVLGRG